MRIRVTLLIMICSLSLLNGCIGSEFSFHEGIQSFKIQNYRQAFILLKPIAIKGQPDAQYAIGYMYYYGQGVVEDRKKAAYWISCAANLGQPDAVAAMKILALG